MGRSIAKSWVASLEPMGRRLDLSFLRKRLFAPFYASFTVLVVLLLAQEVLSVAVNIARQRTAQDITQTVETKRESERLLRSALEAKVALRGYLLTDNQDFLKQYQAGRDTFEVSFHTLSSLLAEDASQRDTLILIRTFDDQWLQKFAQPVIDGTFDRAILAEESSLDILREAVNRILDYEKSILVDQNKRLARLDRLNQVGLGLSGIGIGLIVVGGALNLILLRRRILTPLRQLIRVGDNWRNGQLAKRIKHVSEDPMGDLATTLNGMAEGISVRQERIQQRNQQLGDLISTLSHDLRTPLLANRGMLNAIVRGAFGPVSDLLKDLLKDYREANDNLIKLVETLLDISRYEAQGSQLLNCEPLNWEKICHRVILWVQDSSEKQCEFTVDIAPNIPQVYGDAIEIQRVLQNLIENAVRLSDLGKPVSIKISSTAAKSVSVAVSDQGPGLKEEEISSLFYRFSQGPGRQGRAGLGLYLCRQIVEAHGGKIWVESILGQGATFEFMLLADHSMCAAPIS
ncbi:MAG: ATP-binding protein [Cyanobacteria bacterium J06656_5]